MLTRWLYCLGFVLCCGGTEAAEPWPQFRGPNQGVADVDGVPLHWKEDSGIRWKVELPGLGHSSPVHDGQTIWLTTASPDGKHLGLLAVDASTGKLTWEVSLFKPATVEEIHADNSYASPSPILHDGRVLAHFGTYGTACVDAASGEVLWRNENYHIKHDGGPGSSPVLFENKLILTYDGADAQFVVALDTATGQEVWKRNRSAPFRENPITHRAFATPLITQAGNGQWLLISPGADQCHAYNPATGEELWHVRYVGFSTVPCPVADADRAYFCTGFFKPNMLAVPLSASGEIPEEQFVWKTGGPIPDTPSPLLYQGRIYTVSNQGISACHNAETGERVWIKRLGGNYSASPLALGGRIYFSSEEGVTHIISPSDEPPDLISNKLNGAIKATPALLGSDLLIRTDKALYCVRDAGEQ